MNITEHVLHEHLVKSTIVESEYYPDHSAPRTESSTFRHTKAAGHKAGMRCAISGQPAGVEYHHVFCEWADADAVCWKTVKGIATGEITELPVLGLDTDLPTTEMAPVEGFLIYWIAKLAAARGFDWTAFDPAMPEQFIDSPQNMLVLHEKFHRAPSHGIHMRTAPTFLFQAFPRKEHFIFTLDEAPTGQS